MNVQVAAALRVLPDYLSQHVLLSIAAIVLGCVVGLPLSVLAVRRPRLRWPLLTATSLIQTIPGLALLALFYPILLALSAISTPIVGHALPALGFLPALVALTLYALLPIVRGTIAGFESIDPAILEAADGVGMTDRQRLWRVEAPLAAPILIGGLRTAAVWTIGAATLATPIGQTSLGNYIFAGLQTENWVFVLFGCACSALLAMAVDQCLALIGTGVAQRRLPRILAGTALLVVGTIAALAPLVQARGGATYTLGSKNFSEQYILQDLMAMRLEAADAQVTRREGLGSAIIFRALTAGDIDAYVEYAGTLWTNAMQRHDTPSRDAMIAQIRTWLHDTVHVETLGSLGFENAYALAMRRDRAAALGIETIDDLARHAPDLTLGADLEFLDRPEWSTLRDSYGLRFRRQRSFNPTFMYRALSSGEADVISAFSSDGRILADDLVVLADPRHAIPSYDALLLIAPKRADDPVLRNALMPLVGAIDIAAMRAANLAVDRDTGKETVREAAAGLAQAIGVAR